VSEFTYCTLGPYLAFKVEMKCFDNLCAYSPETDKENIEDGERSAVLSALSHIEENGVSM
jgi:hypothetical protein